MIPGIVAGAGLGTAPGPDPLPSLPNSANIRSWFVAERDAYSDAGASVPCANNDPVQHWLNQGLAADHGEQATSGNRPIFKTGGLNGKPYVHADPTAPHFFANLAEMSQPSGITGYAQYTFFCVVDNIRAGGAATPAIIGGNTGTKGIIYFQDSGGNNVMRWVKSQLGIALPDSTGPNVMMCARRGGAGFFASGSHAAAPTSITQNTNQSGTATTGVQFFRHNGGNPMDGDVYEIIFYNTWIGETNSQTVIDYLKTKYGIS